MQYMYENTTQEDPEQNSQNQNKKEEEPEQLVFDFCKRNDEERKIDL